MSSIIQNRILCIGADVVLRSSKRRLLNRRDFAARNLIVATVTWTPYVTANVLIVAVEEAIVAVAIAGVEAEMAEILDVVVEEEEEEILAAAAGGTSIAGQDDPDHQSTLTHHQEQETHTYHAVVMMEDMVRDVDRRRQQSVLYQDQCRGPEHHHAVVALRVDQ